MAEISEVPGIGGPTLELFKRAGVEEAQTLAQRGIGEILADLEAASRDYEVPVRLPSEAAVRTWQNAAKSLLRRSGQVEMLPAATEVDNSALEAAGIDVKAMPVAREVKEEPDARPQGGASETALKDAAALPPAPEQKPVGEAAPKDKSAATSSPAAPEAVPSSVSRPENPKGTAGALVQRRIEGEARPKAKAAERSTPGGPPRANRFRPTEELQRATPPAQRRNRGMSHPDAGRVRLAAAVTVFSVLLSTAAALSLAGALIMATFYGWHFEWTIALVILAFPLSLFLYLAIGTRVRCRLCGQRLFVPKNCHKHERARRSIFGYTFAVARDATFLGGYRCMLCGTKTRLRN